MLEAKLVACGVLFVICSALGITAWYEHKEVATLNQSIGAKDKIISTYAEAAKAKLASDTVTDKTNGATAVGTTAAETKYDNHMTKTATSDTAVKAKYEKQLAALRAQQNASTDPAKEQLAEVQVKVDEANELSATRVDEAWKYYCQVNTTDTACAPPPAPAPAAEPKESPMQQLVPPTTEPAPATTEQKAELEPELNSLILA